MELSIIKRESEIIVALFDDDMRLVKPVWEFLKYQRLRGMAHNTIKAYGRDLKIFWDYLKHSGYAYDEMSIQRLGGFVEFLRQPQGRHSPALFQDSSRQPQTINHILGTVHSFYQYCEIMNQVEPPIFMKDIARPQSMFKSFLYHTRRDNQTKQSIFKVKESGKAVRLVQPSEIDAVSAHLGTSRDRLILKTLQFTGARITEVLELRITDIPYPDPASPISSLQDIKSKGGRRTLYLPTSLLEEIDRYILEERALIDTAHDYIFVSLKKEYYGKPLSYRAAYEVFHTAMKKAGVSFHFHALRHTFISALVESGMDISVVRIIAGHRQITTTQQYTHISNRYLFESLSKYWSSCSGTGGAHGE